MAPFHERLDNLRKLVPYLGGAKYHILLAEARVYSVPEDGQVKKFTDSGSIDDVGGDTHINLGAVDTSKALQPKEKK